MLEINFSSEIDLGVDIGCKVNKKNRRVKRIWLIFTIIIKQGVLLKWEEVLQKVQRLAPQYNVLNMTEFFINMTKSREPNTCYIN
jgi:hypothetical protein